jgi:hypothetical protein
VGMDESAFVGGESPVMIETQDGLDAGLLVGVSPFGVVFRATHRMVEKDLTEEEREEVGLTEEDSEVSATKPTMELLGRPVLTMLPWQEIKRIELATELEEDAVIRTFREQLDVEDGIPADLELDDDLDTVLDEDDDSDDPDE